CALLYTLLFFLITRRPPRSTLFPSRRSSDLHDAPDSLVARGEQDVQRPLDVDGARGERVLDGAWHRAQRAEVEDDLGPAHGVVEDRKSTRLNSSHVAISYAVFCLKKKKKKKQ